MVGIAADNLGGFVIAGPIRTSAISPNASPETMVVSPQIRLLGGDHYLQGLQCKDCPTVPAVAPSATHPRFPAMLRALRFTCKGTIEVSSRLKHSAQSAKLSRTIDAWSRVCVRYAKTPACCFQRSLRVRGRDLFWM